MCMYKNAAHSLTRLFVCMYSYMYVCVRVRVCVEVVIVVIVVARLLVLQLSKSQTKDDYDACLRVSRILRMLAGPAAQTQREGDIIINYFKSSSSSSSSTPPLLLPWPHCTSQHIECTGSLLAAALADVASVAAAAAANRKPQAQQSSAKNDETMTTMSPAHATQRNCLAVFDLSR